MLPFQGTRVGAAEGLRPPVAGGAEDRLPHLPAFCTSEPCSESSTRRKRAYRKVSVDGTAPSSPEQHPNRPPGILRLGRGRGRESVPQGHRLSPGLRAPSGSIPEAKGRGTRDRVIGVLWQRGWRP